MRAGSADGEDLLLGQVLPSLVEQFAQSLVLRAQASLGRFHAG
jgi:hypothetical protein